MKRQKRTAVILTMVLIMILTACGNRKDQKPSADHRKPAQEESSKEDTGKAAGTEKNTKASGKNILIAYFTWADNTKVENPADVDMDASTSASVLPPGNVARMADWIQQEVGGDKFSIRVKDQYSSDYDKCLDRAADEKAQNARPELTEHVDDLEQYETVFIGYPNWWYSVPMPVLTFIKEHNLSGKKVVLFCSHGTGGLADSVQNITAELPDDSKIEKNVIGVYRDDIPGAQPEVQKWLKEIGY